MTQFDLGFLGVIVCGFVAYPMINAWVPRRAVGWYLLAYLALVMLAAAAIVYRYDAADGMH